ncbi:MaoC/PaaZ C-terminal domain-containing protein [Mycobacterium aquaticum]|uniref:MaoC-like domain-containing protein n=1 Tax=Mycobacterium aquaticum TaxID=1927124 RepID=A0A1X0AV89_9MYCO|nr:MaoC/PaaZ C-terminal domain-containing protein [Mycobacterium aquaticum]ORA33984.1 hypothetical protein BST13_18665 [Mycobacterium aquaticum]
MNETAKIGIGGHITSWHPGSAENEDLISVERARQLAATLDLSDAFTDGDALPLLWHWAYFLDWPQTGDLGPDGHPRDGQFLPPIPNRRRMFAGGRITVSSPLEIGESAVRRSTVARTTVKVGRTGEMLFVTVRYEYRQGGHVCMVEEQDLVYRSGEAVAAAFDSGVESLGLPAEPWTAHPRTHPVLLFRFSALTGNAHRIHYDEAYTTGTEGYPGMVVHGPLLAVYLAELVREHAPRRAVEDFEYRFTRPVFVGDEIRVTGRPVEGGADLAIWSRGSTAHATGKVRYR